MGREAARAAKTEVLNALAARGVNRVAMSSMPSLDEDPIRFAGRSPQRAISLVAR